MDNSDDAELGQQPWLVYGILLSRQGYSATVSAGNGEFSLLGFLGLYTALSVLFFFLVWCKIERIPEKLTHGASGKHFELRVLVRLVHVLRGIVHFGLRAEVFNLCR